MEVESWIRPRGTEVVKRRRSLGKSEIAHKEQVAKSTTRRAYLLQFFVEVSSLLGRY